MFESYNLKRWVNWRAVRAHACSAAAAASLGGTWRVPRDAFRHGALAYLAAYTVAMAAVALPLTLLQLAVGQLSQQDAVGVWRAVPFFKGVGYVKLLVSFLTAVYSVVYVALAARSFFYSATQALRANAACVELDGETGLRNYTDCLNESYLWASDGNPEFYVSVAVLALALWMLFPFMLYNPVKFMKRLFYGLTPVVLILCIVVASCISESSSLSSLAQSGDWRNYLQPYLWHGALTQAMISSQITGGFMISAGYSIYDDNNVLWVSLVLGGMNLAASYGFVLFWYGTSDSGAPKDQSVLAVLVQMYRAARYRALSPAWPAAISAMLFFSGILTMITLVFPLYERLRRLRAIRWRSLAVCCSALGAALSVASLAVAATPDLSTPGLPTPGLPTPDLATPVLPTPRLPNLGLAVALLDEIAVPLLVHLSVAMEVAAFVFIYGWRTLREDIEFLTGRCLWRYWWVSWCAAPGVSVALTAWWAAALLAEQPPAWPAGQHLPGWPWRAAALPATAGVAALLVVVCAACTVAHQCQFDIVSKVKASFTPSRHWGPRDPITHYYWLARREEVERGEVPRPRWQLGQLSRGTAVLSSVDEGISNIPEEIKVIYKLRSLSDDLFWTVYRREEFRKIHQNKRRSRSLDWRHIFTQQKYPKKTLVLSAFDIHTPKGKTQNEQLENVINSKVSIEPE